MAKRRLHVELGADDDSHCLDNIKYSHPKATPKTLRTSLHDSPLVSAEHNLEANVPTLPGENQASNIADSVHYVIVVQESDCDVHQWHICQVPFVRKKICFAMQARARRKCTQKLPLSILAPTYFGVFHMRSKNKNFEQFFYFCHNDIARCIKGT